MCMRRLVHEVCAAKPSNTLGQQYTILPVHLIVIDANAFQNESYMFSLTNIIDTNQRLHFPSRALTY